MEKEISKKIKKSPLKKILVCGDRNYTNKSLIKKCIENELNTDCKNIIIHGGCKGADKLSGIIAKELNLETKVFPADWDKYGTKAGPIRNKEMLDYDPDIILAFHDDLENSKGTKNMVTIARKKGVPVKVIKT